MAWGYTTKARPGPRRSKGQQGEKEGTVMGMGGWKRGEPRGMTLQQGLGKGSCKMNRRIPAAEGGEMQEKQPAPCSGLC